MTSPVRRRAGALAATAVLVLSVAGCGQDTETEPTSASDAATKTPSPSPTDTTSPSDTATASETPTEPGSTDGSTVVPLYFAGDTPRGQRLFREFQRLDGDPLTAAAEAVESGSALDPDYRTLWPGGAIDSVEASDGMLVVRLNADAFTEAPDGMRKKEARLAVQQLVYTLQAGQQARVPVQFLRDSGPQTLFGLDIVKPFKQADQISVLALVNVTSPAQGERVKGGSFTASGVASSFEATVPWEVRKGKKVVLDGFATAEGWMGRLYPWKTKVDVSSLDPGDYTFVAMTDDPSGGAEGAGSTEDTKDFTIG